MKRGMLITKYGNGSENSENSESFFSLKIDKNMANKLPIVIYQFRWIIHTKSWCMVPNFEEISTGVISLIIRGTKNENSPVDTPCANLAVKNTIFSPFLIASKRLSWSSSNEKTIWIASSYIDFRES